MPKQSLRTLIERACAEGHSTMEDAITALEIDEEELAGIVMSAARSVVNSGRTEECIMIFGWGVILGYYYGLKKVGDEALAVQRECEGKK